MSEPVSFAGQPVRSGSGSPSVGDLIPQTTLETEYAAYAVFCEQRAIRPATFGKWLETQKRGFGNWKQSKDSQESIVRTSQQSQDDDLEIRAMTSLPRVNTASAG